jgi:heme/copper-type cytochrome/quinol oxidase subunit 1
VTPPVVTGARPEVVTRSTPPPGPAWIERATSADHKSVAVLYLGAALSFLVLAVTEFTLMRVQLIVPDNTMIHPEIFNRLLSVVGVTAVVLFAIPLAIALFCHLVPLQIGARGVAFPRLTQLSFWLYLAGGASIYAGFFYTPPEAGFAALPPLSDELFTPAHGVDAWVLGVGLAVLGFTCFAVNLVVTVHRMRAPGMAWRRLPPFSWAATVSGYLLLFAGPVMLAALTMLMIDRQFDGIFFDPGEGGAPLLYEHLAWIFFTSAQAIILLLAAGVISEILPTFSRKPIFSHRAVAASFVAIGVLGPLAWMQNMYAAPLPEGWGYMAMIAAVFLLVPVGTLLFVWIATLWRGAIRMAAPMLFAIGAIVALTFGLAGQLVTAVIPAGWQIEGTTAAQQDTIVVLAGGAVFAGFAALHYWLPKFTGRALAEAPAKLAFGLIAVGLTLYATAMFLAGLQGQPVDVFEYFEESGIATENLVASFGTFLLAAGVLLEVVNVAQSYKNGRPVGHDPWGGATLEWFALSPPPPHNFDAVPDVRSTEPLLDIRDAMRRRAAPLPQPERVGEEQRPPVA